MAMFDPYLQKRLDIEMRAPPRFPAPGGTSWVFGAKLGAGGFGRAYLWNLVSDADQKVIDRVVLKYTEIFTEQILSTGGLGDGQIREVFMQRSLVPNGTPPDRVFTVPLLGAEHCSWSLDAWRFYSPYYAFGDLDGLIATQGPEGPTMTMRREFPEPFAWYLLHRLVSAAVVMDTAFRTSEIDYQVVHCDFKPENIFVGAPGFLGRNSNFPAYPPAYLGDFGNAHITFRGDPHDDLMHGMCTPGWSAPEISLINGGRSPWQVKGGSHTNIWQIGYIMLNVLMARSRRQYDEIGDDEDVGYVPEYKPPPPLLLHTESDAYPRVKYSPELLKILNSMVQFIPEHRPRPQALLELIEEQMPRHTEGMERWGTEQWFEELDRGDVDTSVDESMASEATSLRGGERMKNATDTLTEKLKHLLCIPTARPKHRRTPIDRDTSPFSASKARAARAISRKRRQDMVERQIREGLRPKLRRYVSPDPSDDIFVLADDLKIKHPQREWTLTDYFTTPDPIPTVYRGDIDDIAVYATARLAFDNLHPEGYRSVGKQTYNFRKDGEAAGEIVYLPKPKQPGSARAEAWD